MPRVIADIILPKELIKRFTEARIGLVENATPSSQDAAKTLGDRIRQIINKRDDYLDEELQDCFHDAAILLKKLPEKVQQKIMNAILNQPQQDLDLSWCRLNHEQAGIIADLLYFTGVTNLDVSNNNIGAEGACALAQNATLLSLDVSLNEIDDEGAYALAQNSTLSSLDMNHNNIGAEGACALAQNATLLSLNMWGNKISDKGACALAQNATLLSLDVNLNKIGDEGAYALAQNSTLSSLNVSYTNIGDEGACALAQNATLSSLDVRGNNIGDKGACALAQNASLTNLDVSWNNIGFIRKHQIETMLVRNNHKAEFRNEVRTIGEGVRNSENFFSTEDGLPIEVTVKIVDMLAKEHGLFAHKKLKEVINNNLFPECKREISQS